MSRVILVISIACLIYLSSLQIAYYYTYNNQIFQFFGELLTIPSMLFAIFGFFFCLVTVLRKKNDHLLPFIINVITILMCVVGAVFDDS